MLLAGDIGGTKIALAIYPEEGDPGHPQAQATFSTREYGSLAQVVQAFLGDTGTQVDRAVFGVAGPVVRGRAQVTNLAWELDEGELRAVLGVRWVKLLNDLEAIAHGVPVLAPQDLHTLHPGEPEPGGAKGIIAPGTGLGEAFLTWQGRRYQAHPSEGGHADFAPTDEEQVALLRYLWPRYPHVSYERVCSGLGIPNLYAFYRDTGRQQEPAWLAQALAQAEDPTPVIVEAALERPDQAPICVATLRLFVSILGAEAGNLALKILATGGIYLGGGIPPRILPFLEEGPFWEAFRHKGRFAGLLESIPVHVILNPLSGLLGAANYGLNATVEGAVG